MSPRSDRPPRLSILHLDDDLVVIDKPPGVLAVPGRGGRLCALDLLRATPPLGPDDPLRIVHRLDQDASGVLVYARTLRAQQALVRQFMDRRVEKTYLALVSGYVAGDGEIALPISYERGHNRVVVGRGGGKPALTRYRIRQRLAGNTLLECELVTGRMHQLRAHLAAIGHPLTVDPLYGGGVAVLLSNYKPDYRPSARRPERPLIERLTLHAARIRFRHPVTEVELTFEAPLPKDLRATVNQLGRLR